MTFGRAIIVSDAERTIAFYNMMGIMVAKVTVEGRQFVPLQRGIYIAQSWGEKTYTFIMQIVPVLLVGLVMGGVRPPASLGALVLFLVTVALG